MGEKRNAYRILVGKRPLGRPRSRWEDNIKTDLKRGGVVWTGLISLRKGSVKDLANLVMNLRVIQNIAKFFIGCASGDFSKRAQFHRVRYLKHFSVP
jgi:hypothetical protein